MTQSDHKINLSSAIAIFEENLDEIADNLAINITDKIESLPPPKNTDNETEKWLWDEIRKLEIKQITEVPLSVIKRIQSRQYYMSIPEEQRHSKITEEDIQRAKEVPIETLYGGRLHRSGGKLWGRCPFHQEKTPSFCVHKDNHWSCFAGCGHGDSIDYIQKRDGVKFIQAVKQLINI